MTTEKVREIIDNLTPSEKKELDLAKRLLTALLKGPVMNLGGSFCISVDGKLESLKFDHTDMCDAVRCLQRLNCEVYRTDAGGRPTWALFSMPSSLK